MQFVAANSINMYEFFKKFGVPHEILILANYHFTSVNDLCYELDRGVNVRDFTLTVPLHWKVKTSFGHMCIEDNKDMVQAFLKRTSTNVEDICGIGKKNAAHLTAMMGHKDVMCVLVEEYNANLEALDSFGWTPLKCAAIYGHLEMFIYLVKKGANLKAKDNGGYSILDNLHENIADYIKALCKTKKLIH